ncbi:unnamed protein product [Coregonus sp. 'balchen']|nr:unnamed protein product [Coregonus sp. 'balchen']
MEIIIFAVSSKQCLFDTTADSYRDLETSVHDSRIASLAYNVHVYVEEDCRRKWRGLRDRYQRARRAEKEKKRSGSAASGQRPWRFCHILSFLDPFITLYVIHKCDHRLHQCSETLYVIYKCDHRCSETLYNVYVIHKYDHHRCSHGRG